MSQGKLSAVFGHSRQNFNKRLKLMKGRNEQSAHLIELIQQVRHRQPNCGFRKMHNWINQQLLLRGQAPIGRDRGFDVLREHQLLVPKRKRKAVTTDSYHRFRTHKNLLKKTEITGPNQAWVSDITYLRLQGQKFCYLFLVTDYYSRKIVGYHLSTSLGVDGALKALRMALRQSNGTKGIIHHSDRGVQYCCDAYADLMDKNSMLVSMTEENHCYENARAERVNETLKYDLMLSETFQSFFIAKIATKEAVEIYNKERWHEALGYLTPEMKHAA